MRTPKKILSLLLAAALCISTVPTTAFAENSGAQDSGVTIGASGLCEHHAEHTADCGYTEGTPETPCAHEHGAECYPDSVSGSAATPTEAAEPTNCTHTEHTGECGYAPAVEGTAEIPCIHEHDDSCGYAPASDGVEETPCAHEHDEGCGYVPAAEGTPETPCAHEHGAECYPEADGVPGNAATPSDAAEPTNCPHTEHTADCGYAPATEGTPCGYVCEICNPTVKTITSWAWNDEYELIVDGSIGLIWNSVAWDDLAPMLPSITATIGEAEEILTLDWSCVDVADGMLTAGTHTLTAALPEGYALGEDVPALTLTLEMGGGAAFATATVSYLDASGNSQTASNATVVESSTTTWTNGWYVVNSDVAFDTRITVSGDVHLILADNATLTASAGIQVQDNDNDISNGSTNSLTIYAQSTGENMGKLTAKCNDENAAIGGNADNNGGTIVINGGNVTAGNNCVAWNVGGAGIGGGQNGAGGNITINGGTVTANSYAGAGIGGGYSGTGGNITISGGTVTADGYGGAGIGGGNAGAGGNIIISGGTIEASNEAGAGIGGGQNGAGGSITISGGTIEASSKQGAGVGGGSSGTAGTFSTGNNGNAFINASSIQDNDNTTGWSGVIFGGETDPTIGKVYGSSVELTTDAEIPGDKELVIGSGQTLTIGSGATLTNSGVIDVTGTISGSLGNNGTIVKRSGANLPADITGTGNTIDVPAGDVIVGAFTVSVKQHKTNKEGEWYHHSPSCIKD